MAEEERIGNNPDGNCHGLTKVLCICQEGLKKNEKNVRILWVPVKI
jgi:hypothetical protein